MDNANESQLGGVRYESKKSWAFWAIMAVLSYLLYQVGKLSVLVIPKFINGEIKIGNGVNRWELIALFILLIIMCCLVIVHFVSLFKSRLFIHEFGLTIDNEEIIFSQVTRVTYKRANNRSLQRTLLFELGYSKKIGFMPSMFDQKDEILNLVKLKLADKLESSDF
jgi:hypothetical protein